MVQSVFSRRTQTT